MLNIKALTALVIVLINLEFTHAQSAEWGQCGGLGWTGPTTCVAGSTCTYSK